jgi:hypothetical protein
LTQKKYVLAYVEKTTMGEILQTWGEVTGKPTAYVQTSLEEYNKVWPMWAQEMGIMMQFWDEYGENSWSGEDFLTSKELGIKEKFAGIRETFETTDWSFVFGK